MLAGVDGESAQAGRTRLAPRAFELSREIRSARALLAELEPLVELRRELGRRRGRALTLIYDREEYFYPHLPPDCPSEKARLYPAVQREVERRVAAVREIWSSTLVVELPARWRASLSELQQIAATSGLQLEQDLELPAWVAGIDPALERVGVRELALDAAGRSLLDYDRAVEALNEAAWGGVVEGEVTGGADRTSAIEIEQVQITNGYRRMLGRRVLAFDPRIHEAARGHSEFMERSGQLGHREPQPERRDVYHRLRLAGYDAGASENLWYGRPSAMGAHLAWCSSSEHHRNLLDPDVYEMASGLAGAYWTQNLGRGKAFQGELDEWQH